MLNITAAPDQQATKEESSSPLWLRISVSCFVFIFIIGGFYSGYLFYSTVRAIVARAELPALPAFQLPSSIRVEETYPGEQRLAPLPEMGVAVPPETGQSVVAYVPPPAPSDSSDRINILLLGIDRRGKKGWGFRTDTIIIVTVDRANGTAGMLSIPRDLQIPIPGNGEDRINTANVWGESRDYPGGGAALLKRTIEANFDIPIDYYIMIDFRAFEEIVDTLGGIDVNVPSALHDTKYPEPKPDDPHGYKTVHFDAGMQHMDGDRALEYARSRMSTSDFDRAKRQQRILIAIREKALNLNLIPKLPTLASTMMNTIKTDMVIEEMLELAVLGSQIDMGSVKQVVLQKPLVYGYRREDGAAVQLPKWDLLEPVIDELFTSPVQVAPTPTPAPPTPTPTLAPEEIAAMQELAREGARIAVQNGTSEANYAARVAAMLMEEGYQVVEFGDAERLDYVGTVIVDYTGKAYSIDQLSRLFQVQPDNVRHSPNVRSTIDIRVIVGEEFRLVLP
ncbi:LCP family protein [Chloroflexota bacterium]